MSITLAALLLLGVNGIFAGLAPTPSKVHGSTVAYVRYAPTVKSASVYYSYPYTYWTYYSHNVKYIYVSESCSSPPSSIEICLTSMFSSMEAELTLINYSLRKHEVSIKNQMHHEHTLLYSEVSWVEVVDKIAKSVKEAVEVDYENLEEQVYDLVLEKEQIYAAYEELVEELELIFAEVKDVQEQEVSIYYEYKKIYYAKWSIYSYISAIVYEKEVVAGEVIEIQEVVSYLNIQIKKISAKVAQLVKRQNWLTSWQNKLYIDLEYFQVNIKKFKEVESHLKIREESLYKEQARLLLEAEYAKAAVEKLKLEYVHVVEYLNYLQAYEKEIYQLYYYVSGEASVFISAYEEFTCQDSLLYYEACSSSSSSSSSSMALGAPAPAAPVV